MATTKFIHNTSCADKSSDYSIGPKIPWTSIAQMRFPSHDTCSENAFRTVNRWIGECFEGHRLCSKRTVSSLPKRVLEISGGHIYLRELQGRQAKYACLSHCWGKKGAALQLTNATLEMLIAGLPREHLPRTFRDAVHVSCKLGIQYLWIDALCE